MSVLIIGAGPVGLATGIALRRWGIDCTVVEKHPSTLPYPKGRGVSARSMEIFRQWGLEADITAAGLPRAETEYFFLGETLLTPEFQRFDRAELGRKPTPSPTERLICPQDLVEKVLLRHAIDSGVDVRFHNELVAIDQDDSHVYADVRDPRTGVEETIEATYVVAADGGRSTVRSLLGIGVTGPGAIGSSVSILVHAELAERVADRLAIIYKLEKPHPSAFFAVVDNDRRWLLMMSRDPDTEPDELFDDAHCIELVRAALGDDDVPFELQHHWFFEPTAQVADTFRDGRVFLAGDAAHLTTPFGALGMNCGIADAHNLAWKLAGVLQGWASPHLLTTYDTERRPVAVATSEASILREDISTGPPRAAFAGITLGYAYESPAVIPDDTPRPDNDDPVHDYVPTARPGHRAPHVWLDVDGARQSTLDLYGSGFVLLVAGDTPLPTPSTTAPLRSHAIHTDEWREVYGLEPGGAILVRPDGHVAWRSARPDCDVIPAATAALKVATGHDHADAAREQAN